jgi:hypothetical protein
MTEPKQAWDEVGERFAALGRQLKTRFDQEREGDDRQAVRDAVGRLAEAARRLGDSVGEAVRDPAVKQQARDVARSLNDALATTFREVGEQIRPRPSGQSPGQGSQEAATTPEVRPPDASPTGGSPYIGSPDGETPAEGASTEEAGDEAPGEEPPSGSP